jgi:uncharacterized protein (TIGR01440 family)
MEKINIKNITNSVHLSVESLLAEANLKPKQILIIGCSTSEVTGARIGSASNEKIAKGILKGIKPFLDDRRIFLAVQCCEHLNRALVIEEECASCYCLNSVNAIPHKKAGGAFATLVYKSLSRPVVVETIKAHAGIDIGDTFIGMNLKPVAVPVRCDVKKIGFAHLTMARSRDKYIGGERAKYNL